MSKGREQDNEFGSGSQLADGSAAKYLSLEERKTILMARLEELLNHPECPQAFADEIRRRGIVVKTGSSSDR